MYAFATPRNLLDEFFRDTECASPKAAAFRPLVDIAQTENGYILRTELAGVPKESVRVEIKNQALTIAGEKPALSVEAKGYRYSEIHYGKFERTFHLAETIDTDRLEAKFDNGVLEVKLHHKPELGPKQVQIV